MDELAPLVKKRGVVLVALDDEPRPVRETRALAKIIGHPADEKAGVQAVVLEDPGQQRRGGGFAVRAGHDQRPFAANEKLLEQFAAANNSAACGPAPLPPPALPREMALPITTRSGLRARFDSA